MVLLIALITVAGLLTGGSAAFAQSDERETLIGVNIGGPVFGVYSGTVQQLLQNDLSIFVRGGYFDPKWSGSGHLDSLLTRLSLGRPGSPRS